MSMTASWSMGIDIGGTKTAAVVLGPDGTVLTQVQAASGRGPAAVVEVAADVAGQAASAVGGWTDIGTVGACMPGLVDPSTGVVTHAVNLGVNTVNLVDGLAQALGRPVVIDNDVKAAGLGAYTLHRGERPHSFGYLNVGTGLAAALLVAGHIVRGPGGIAGEIGHLPLAASVRCRCGQTGCLEASASGLALTRMWPPARRHADPFAAAADGDQAAAEAVASLCDGIATAVQVLVLTAGVERIVIGGGLARLGAPLASGITQVLTERADQSPMLAELALWTRFSLLPSDVPIAALGAAFLPTAGAPAATDPAQR